MLTEEAPKKYEPGGTLNEIRPLVQNFLEKYNIEYPAKKMELVLFNDALEHLLRINRLVDIYVYYNLNMCMCMYIIYLYMHITYCIYVSCIYVYVMYTLLWLYIHRLMEMPRGSALLVGVGGSGKQSLTRLSSYISRAHCFQITLTKQYNKNSFIEDMKLLYKSAGQHRKPTTFLFTESEIKDEVFLEYINSILLTGVCNSIV